MSTLKVYMVEDLSEGMQEKQGRSARCSWGKKGIDFPKQKVKQGSEKKIKTLKCPSK